MKIDEIKNTYSEDIFRALLDTDKDDKGYICPFCGSGSGNTGTGLRQLKVDGVPRPGSYHCFNAGCLWTGDGLDLIAGMFNIPKDDRIAQAKKAEEILHRPLLDVSERKAQEENFSLPPGRFNGTGQAFTWDKIDLSDFDDEAPAHAAEKTHQEDDKNKSENNDELLKEIQAEMKQYAANLLTSERGLAYLKARGISKDTAIKYKLGFCDNYNRDGMNTPAIIFPDGPTSYTARSITTDEGGRKVRKRKAGTYQDIFNIGILQQDSCPKYVYIVEGQADALAIIEAGGQAIATGGGTSERRLKEEIERIGPARLPVFILLPDNDRKADGTPDEAKGYSHAAKIEKALDAATPPINNILIDTRDPGKWPSNIKDANQYLTERRADFVKFIKETTGKVKEEYEHQEGRFLGRTSEFVQEFLDKIAGDTPPIPTGYHELDEILGNGLHPGLIVLGAISSLGKTTFCLNLAEKMAAAGTDVLFFSLEMSRYELISKLISRETAAFCIANKKPLNLAKSNLGISDFSRYGSYKEEERELILKCGENFANNAGRNLCVIEGVGNIGTVQIRQDIKNYKAQTGRTPVIIIDYAQILAPADPRSTDKQNTDKNIVELKRISRDYNTPVIVISSFNRENYTAPVNMTAFKESGALEYTSDVLIGLQHYGMDYIKGEKEAARLERIRDLVESNNRMAAEGKSIKIQLKILKNRSGRKGSTGLNYFPMFNLYI